MTEKRKIARRVRRKKKRENKLKERCSFSIDDFSSPERLYHSYRAIRSKIKWKSSCQYYGMNVITNILQASSALGNGEIISEGYKEFVAIERGKRRNIKAPSMREKVVQKSLCDYVLKPAISPTLIYDNGASLKGKGIGFSRKRIIRHLSEFYRKHGLSGWALTIDFKSYFDSVNHDVLLAEIKKYIPDEKLFSVIGKYYRAIGRTGLGIGSEISQIAALFYLSKIDHIVKERLRMSYYGRYMDDAYIISESKEVLLACLERIMSEASMLKIRLNMRKVRLCRLKYGVIFLKTRYIFSRTGKILRLGGAESARRTRRKLRKFREMLSSGCIMPEKIKNDYISWRVSTLRNFDCKKSVALTDKLFQELFL